MMVGKSFNIYNAVAFKENLDIEEALDEAGHARYNFFVLVSCCVLNIGATMDLMGFNMIVPAASCDLDLSLNQIGILTSVSFAGYVTAIPWGYISDTIGRRRAMLLSGAVGFLMSAISSFSTSFVMMVVIKFIGSCFSTASMTFTIIFLGENTSMKYRSRYVFILNAASFGADFICFVIAYLVLPLDLKISIPFLGIYKSWRLLTLVLSIPMGIGSLLIWFLEESPMFLVSLGNTKEALKILKRISKINNGIDSIYPVSFLRETAKIDEDISFCKSIIKQTVPIFQLPLLWRTLQLFLLYCICSATSTVFYMWFPAMMNSYFITKNQDSSFCQMIVANITPIKNEDICIENGSMSTIYSGLIFTFVIFMLNVIVIAFANWRRTVIIGACIISGTCCIIVDMVHNFIASIALFFMIQIVAVALGSVETYYIDIFPTSYRSFATSLGSMVARVACLGGVSLMGVTVINYCRLSFYCWAFYVFCGIPLAILLPGDVRNNKEIK